MEKKECKTCKCKKGLISLFVGVAILHTVEWLTIGKKVAEAANVPVSEARIKCLTQGITWWKPLKDSLVHKQPLDQ